MRCLILSSEFPPGPGGVGTHAFELSKHLTKLGWEVTVTTRQDYSSEEERERFNNSISFDIYSLRPQVNQLVDFFYRLRITSSIFRDFSPDIIIVTGNARVALLGYLLAKWYSIPCLAVGHGSEFGSHQLLNRILIRFVFSSVSCVVCVSEFTKNYMLKSGVKPKKVVVIPNGADETVFRRINTEEIDNFRSAKDLDGRIVLVTVGNVTDRKGQDIVIQSLPEVIKEFREIVYIAIGLPTLADNLQLRIKELKLTENVRFVGRISNDDLVRYLNVATLHIMVSRHTSNGDFEGYGIAVLEAALCGTPSIVAANSGLVEAVDNGQSGIIVPDNDPNATAQAIIQVLKNETLAASLAERVYRLTLAEKTWSKRIEQYEYLLWSLVGR